MSHGTNAPRPGAPEHHDRNDDDDETNTWFDRVWAAWWTRVVFGALVIAGGAYIYNWLAMRELSGGRTRMPAVFVAIYAALGKTGILAVFIAIGVGCIGSALYSRLTRSRGTTPG